MTIVEVRQRGVWPLTSKWAAAQDGQSIMAESAGPAHHLGTDFAGRCALSAVPAPAMDRASGCG